MKIDYSVDPLTRYVFINYTLDKNLNDIIKIKCEVSINNNTFRNASVLPYISDTAYFLMQKTDKENGLLNGEITELYSSGMKRTLVWNPFKLIKGNGSAIFRITVYQNDYCIGSSETEIKLKNNDVVYIDDFRKVVQANYVKDNISEKGTEWWYKRSYNKFGICETSLEVMKKGIELPQITYQLDLNKYYAIFVDMPDKPGKIELRLTGDDITDTFENHSAEREFFWKWADMARQHVVIKQPYDTVYQYEDDFRAHLKSIRLVPINREIVDNLNDKWSVKHKDKIVIGYNEPGSWAFYRNIKSSLQHWEPIIAFSKGNVDIIDDQAGRGGCKTVYESRIETQLIDGYDEGDPIRGKVPRNNNRSKMQQFTNMIGTEKKYANLVNMKFSGNFGATNCYPGSNLEGDFSKNHPEWRNGSCLKYDVPEVQSFMLAQFDELMRIGVRIISIDWCRYPDSIKNKETVNSFFRRLRQLTEKYKQNNDCIKIITRFPARGVNKWLYMDYKTWIKEHLVDYIVPSNIQGRHMEFSIDEYVEAAKGTDVKVLPCTDALEWGLPEPSMWYSRILDCYKKGADGTYVYQCDNLVYSPEKRRFLSIIGSADTIKRYLKDEKGKQTLYNKNIYIFPQNGIWHVYERIRIFIEGFEPETVEIFIDDKLINKYYEPPYILIGEGHEYDNSILFGKHQLKIMAKDNNSWFQKNFDVQYTE